MWFVFRLLLGVAVAVSVGFGASYYALTDGRLFSAVRSGPWAAWPDIGQPLPDPYSRAFLARTGALQLGYAEGIQFVAHTDDDGQTLRASCNYSIEGVVPSASFWTLEATDLEGRNIAASADLMALHSERIARRGDGEISIGIGPSLAQGNWLPITPGNGFQIKLTLYDALIFSGRDTAIDEMPTIRTMACET